MNIFHKTNDDDYEGELFLLLFGETKKLFHVFFNKISRK